MKTNRKIFILVSIVVALLFASCATVQNDPLSLWTEDAPAKTGLIAYVQAVTDPDNQDYIPPEDRIAVFDFDGTLFCETDPNYNDFNLLVYRVLEDPSYKALASDFEKEVASLIVEMNETGVTDPDLMTKHGQAVAMAFKGMTPEEINAYAQEFKKQPMPSFNNMSRGDGYYLPMVQIVDYLESNGFIVYVISGTDRLLVRASVYNSLIGYIPPRQVIGSDETLVATGQNGTDGLEYIFTAPDTVVTGGQFIIKNLNMNKVTAIVREIGAQPVLSFGNSGSDSSMNEYVTLNNPYRSMAFMVCCDDLDRELGNLSKAQKMYDLCKERGWTAISMKNDWVTIYGDEITKK